MTRQTTIIFVTTFALLLAAIVYSQWSSAPQPETKDRLTPRAMDQMVKGPIAASREDGLAAGRAEFDKLLARSEARFGPNSVQVADLFTAFGVGLYGQGWRGEDQAMIGASRDYLRAAVPRYRKAFGNHHPEVAVALHSFADVDIKLHGERLTAEAEAALEEALRIRTNALGSDDQETRATERRLSCLRRMPAATWPPGSAGRAVEEIEAADCS